MNTTDIIIIVLATATVSTLFSGLLFYFIGKQAYNKKIDQLLNKAAKKIGNEVEQGVIRAVDNRLPELQNRVKAGMLQGFAQITDVSPEVKGAVDLIHNSIKDSLGLFDIFGQGRKKPPQK